MDTDYLNINSKMEDDVLVVTLCWPQRLNAMSHQMRVDLLDCVRRTEKDDAVRAIVLTGDGDRAFCAGANIPELEERTPASEMGPAATLRKELPTAVERLSKPVVAAVNGYCFGAGLELALGCTLRIASENATFAQPEIKLGQIPGSGGTQRLYRFVGLGWAMQMVLTGEPVDARTAQSIGLSPKFSLRTGCTNGLLSWPVCSAPGHRWPSSPAVMPYCARLKRTCLPVSITSANFTRSALGRRTRRKACALARETAPPLQGTINGTLAA